jgi:hypothetical protein
MVSPCSEKTAHQGSLKPLEVVKEFRFGKRFRKFQWFGKPDLFGNGLEEVLQLFDTNGVEHLSDIFFSMGDVTNKVLHHNSSGSKPL